MGSGDCSSEAPGRQAQRTPTFYCVQRQGAVNHAPTSGRPRGCEHARPGLTSSAGPGRAGSPLPAEEADRPGP
jgi:hypothetical protein